MILTAPGASAERCVPQELTINNVELAHAYVPLQKLCPTFTPIGALSKGTAFPAIYQVSRWNQYERGVNDNE